MIKKLSIVSIILFFLFPMIPAETVNLNLASYHNPKEINGFMKNISRMNKKITKLHELAISPGGNALTILEIFPLAGKNANVPAVFVSANFSGVNLISSEAAIYLINQLVKDKEKRKNRRWYILPIGNPDAAWRYFKKPLYTDKRNGTLVNDDMDDAVDEDGYEDLNGDGYITMMRKKDPEGKYIPVPGNPDLLKKADWSKGEKGIYKLYTEGIDNDGDGKYNEDVPGGVDVSVNFPHLFKSFNKTSGRWPGSEPEIYNLFKFIFSHKDIAMTINFGETNFCFNPPKGGRKGSVDYSKIKIPKKIAKFFNADPDKTYSMKTIMMMVKKVIPSGMEVSESMVASFLGLGAVVNPVKDDLKFYNKISEDYKKFIKKAKISLKRISPSKAKDGSFELWSYYHLGIPSFSMDFWTLPKVEKKKSKKPEITAEKLENMSKDDFLALGKDKINAFLKSSGAPKNIKAEFLINAVKNGMMTPKKMAQFMKKMSKNGNKQGGNPKDLALLSFNKKVLKGKGFAKWREFDHPALGKVEIGGKIPFADIIPPANMIKDLIVPQIPFVYTLSDKIAKIKIEKTEIKSLGSGLYRLKVTVANYGYLPYPTAMGMKNKRITPIVVSIKGKSFKIIEGHRRLFIAGLKGMSSGSVKWLLYSSKPVKIKIESFTDNATNDIKFVYIGGGK